MANLGTKMWNGLRRLFHRGTDSAVRSTFLKGDENDCSHSKKFLATIYRYAPDDCGCDVRRKPERIRKINSNLARRARSKTESRRRLADCVGIVLVERG